MEQLSQAIALRQADADQLRYPVLWRWVPSTAATGEGNIPDPATSTNNRIIHASVNIISNESEDSSLLLTGGELLKAREVLNRDKTSILSQGISAAVDGNIHSRSAGCRAEMEAASMLLQMVDGSDKKEKESSGAKKSPDQKTPSSSPTNKDSSSKTQASNVSSQIQDAYLNNWVAGTVSLHTPEDDDVLSPLHCFMRRYCVEAFSATAEDVATPRYGKSHGFKVEIGQVGIRCLHCKHLPSSKRAERAVCYPSSLKNIYHSIETWQRRHSLVCKHITPWVRKTMTELMAKSKTRAGGRRQYWEDSARRLGMVDTSQGLRFCRKPADLGPVANPVGCQLPGDQDAPGHRPEPVVRTEDKDLVTDYLFLLMEQMQTCRFVEADRIGGRSKIKDNKVGFPGMECKHCQGRAGFGRYFPSSVTALSLANSDRNVFNHLLKCRRCPQNIKTQLVALQKTQGQAKNRRGLRKLFFDGIWKRIHNENKTPESTGNAKPPPPTATAIAIQQQQQQPQQKQQQQPQQQQKQQQFIPYMGLQTRTPQMTPSMISKTYGNLHGQNHMVVNRYFYN